MITKTERQINFSDICSQCQNKSCCFKSKPPIAKTRKLIVEKYLAENRIPITTPFAQTDYVFPRVDTEGHCVFFDKSTQKCVIHAVKPETCVAGPVTFDINVKTGKIEWHLKTEKICPLAGVLYKNRNLLEDHLKSAKKEILTLVSGLDSVALKAILKIEEPETFKIDEDDVEPCILKKLGQ
jgi:Fe-S-cluster containining protein